jgi:hypothetical protein
MSNDSAMPLAGVAPLNVRISLDLRVRLAAFSEISGLSMQQIVGDAIRGHLARLVTMSEPADRAAYDALVDVRRRNTLR